MSAIILIIIIVIKINQRIIIYLTFYKSTNSGEFTDLFIQWKCFSLRQ